MRHSLGTGPSMGSFGNMSSQSSLPVYQDRLMGSGTFVGVRHPAYQQPQHPQGGLPPQLPFQPPSWSVQPQGYPPQPFAMQPQHGMDSQYSGVQQGYQHPNQHLMYGQQQSSQQYPPSFMQNAMHLNPAPPPTSTPYPQVVPGGISVDLGHCYSSDTVPTPTEHHAPNRTTSAGQLLGRPTVPFVELDRSSPASASGSLSGSIVPQSPGAGPESGASAGTTPPTTPFSVPEEIEVIQNMVSNLFGDLTDTASDDPPTVGHGLVRGCAWQTAALTGKLCQDLT